MVAVAKQPVDEEVPAFDILDLIEEKVGDWAVDRVNAGKDFIQIPGVDFGEGFVVEIDVAKCDAGFQKRLSADDGLA